MRIFYSSKFLRSFKKLPKPIQDEFRKKEIVFRENPHDPGLRTHKLKDREEWSFLVTYQIRVIFIFENNHALFVNIGDHSIYRK